MAPFHQDLKNRNGMKIRNSSNGNNSKKKMRCTMECLLKAFLILVGVIAVLNLILVIKSNNGDNNNSSTIRQGSSPGKQRQANKNNDGYDGGGYNYHIVFSTSCSYQHDWQSYLFFFHAMMHNQPGDVTRVVSGCDPDQEKIMKKLHEEQFSIMNPNFLIHFTPEFGKQLKGVSFQQTKYWNKPFGLKHWLENRFGYRYEGDISTQYDDDIIILVDPDMLMQRPFINDFTKFSHQIWNKYYRNHPELLLGKVTQGNPVAQDYSFGSQWLRAVSKNLTYVVGPDSPVHHVTEEEAGYVFAAGPPYWMTARDAYRIAYHWSDFLPRIFQLKPVFMAEMYGYCMAAAHLGLRHQMARGFMVSNVYMYEGEGWQFLDNADDTACDVAQFKDSVPHVIHFCQRYSIGEYFINKYLFPTDILSCDFPLVELPPKDILTKVNYSHFGDGTTESWEGSSHAVNRYRHAFMVCSLFPALNQAATFYKNHHCPNGANYDQTWNHFRWDSRSKKIDRRND